MLVGQQGKWDGGEFSTLKPKHCSATSIDAFAMKHNFNSRNNGYKQKLSVTWDELINRFSLPSPVGKWTEGVSLAAGRTGYKSRLIAIESEIRSSELIVDSASHPAAKWQWNAAPGTDSLTRVSAFRTCFTEDKICEEYCSSTDKPSLLGASNWLPKARNNDTKSLSPHIWKRGTQSDLKLQLMCCMLLSLAPPGEKLAVNEVWNHISRFLFSTNRIITEQMPDRIKCHCLHHHCQ